MIKAAMHTKKLVKTTENLSHSPTFRPMRTLANMRFSSRLEARTPGSGTKLWDHILAVCKTLPQVMDGPSLAQAAPL